MTNNINNFKLVTCVLKEEEFFITPANQSPGSIKRRYRFQFKTLPQDMGIGGLQTADTIEVLSLYSMNPDKFQTGKKYSLELKEV